MEDLGKLYAQAKLGSLRVDDEAGVWREHWRELPLTEVWTRRVTTTNEDIYFFKAHNWQYRFDMPYRTFTPQEAALFAETVAEDFARHGIKTDPNQIVDAMAARHLPEKAARLASIIVDEPKKKKA